MQPKHLRSAIAGMVVPFGLSLLLASPASAQRADPQEKLIAERNAIEAELQEIAIVDRKVMVKMRDGKRMAADIYRPKNAKGKVPVIFWAAGIQPIPLDPLRTDRAKRYLRAMRF